MDTILSTAACRTPDNNKIVSLYPRHLPSLILLYYYFRTRFLWWSKPTSLRNMFRTQLTYTFFFISTQKLLFRRQGKKRDRRNLMSVLCKTCFSFSLIRTRNVQPRIRPAEALKINVLIMNKEEWIGRIEGEHYRTNYFLERFLNTKSTF